MPLIFFIQIERKKKTAIFVIESRQVHRKWWDFAMNVVWHPWFPIEKRKWPNWTKDSQKEVGQEMSIWLRIFQVFLPEV